MMLASLLVPAFLSLVQAAPAAPECTPVSKVKEQIHAAIPAADIAEMGGDETRAFLIAFNAEPPKSDIKGDYIVIVRMKDNPLVLSRTMKFYEVTTQFVRGACQAGGEPAGEADVVVHGVSFGGLFYSLGRSFRPSLKAR